MPRARRLASTAVVAILAATGLSACQQSPDVAAYVGDDTITQDRVQKIYDQVKDELTAARQQAQQQSSSASGGAAALTMPIKQQDVLNTLLSLDVLRRSAQAHGVQAAAEPTVDQVAQSRNFSPSWEFTKLYTETYQLRAALQSKVPPATLTEADLRDVYQRLIAGGAADPGTSFEQFSTTLSDQNKQLLQTYVALRNELQTITTDEKVKLNPRYGNQQVTLLSAQSAQGKDVPLVVFTFAGDADEEPYVTDVSTVTSLS
ncbi:SurA N-terminal domain-containing protein [Actinoplanes sp. N902-109]|uniref:SurA N-terminal domain-containing protein n=1 Tax=Actinoplanes sp. (strain N902-109) TaxID=649831 RepID=UPI0018DBDFBD|nr:SurA N-terminal domain-containing protein [Actinoplanes sp. N902-109]